jgi:hypothetical protein
LSFGGHLVVVEQDFGDAVSFLVVIRLLLNKGMEKI